MRNSGLVHAGIFGPTLCGKTTLAMQLCANMEKAGTRCLVLDPYNGDWKASFQTRKMSEFLAVAKKSRSCGLFVDEAGQLDFRDAEHEWIFTGSRHWGHVAHVIGQSGVQMTPLARSSVTRLFLFRSTDQTAEYWRNSFVDDRIRQATTLNRFEFIRAEMFGTVQRCKLTLAA